MRKAAFAEIVLALVMPPERAAATAGDLLESSRGPLSFLIALARTALGAIFEQMSLGTAAKAFFLTTGMNIAGRLLVGTTLVAAGRLVPGLAWMGPLVGISFLFVAPVIVGRLAAGWMPGREMAVWMTAVAVVLLAAPLTLLSTFPWFIGAFLVTPAGLLPMLVGVLRARRRNLRHSRRLA